MWVLTIIVELPESMEYPKSSQEFLLIEMAGMENVQGYGT